MRHATVVLTVLLLAASSLPVTAQEHPHGVPDVEYLGGEGPGPFSEAVRVGPMLYLSGQIGIASEGGLVAGGIGPETRQTLENIRATLERYGSSMDRVVKCTVMMDDISEWGAMNVVYREFFPGNKPARSAFGADGLALGAAVEIECWATVGDA